MKTWGYVKIGLKGLATNLLSNLILGLILALISFIGFFRDSPMGMILAGIFLFMVLLIGIYLNGLLANKIWKWD